MTGQRQVLFMGVVCFVLAVVQGSVLFMNGHNYHHTIQIIIGWGFGAAMGITALAFHIASFPCSRFMPISTVLIKYILHWYMQFHRFQEWRAFQRATNNGTKAQTEFLVKHLRQNEDTIYGQDFNFKDITSVDEFVKQHPLTTYTHYIKYIKRVANGELNIMSRNRPVLLGKTSGTTGTAKMFPVSDVALAEITRSGTTVTAALRSELGIGNVGSLQKTCSLLTASLTSTSEGGIPMGPVTTFMMTDRIKDLLFSTPTPGFYIVHEPTSMYVHALFALRDENLGSIWAPFASSLYIFFRFLEISWHMLVQDIRSGTISQELQSLTVREREALSAYVSPLPDRANELERQFRKGFDNIITRLWPRIPALFAVTSGANQTFVKRLKKYTGDLKIFSGFYVSTEGLMGYACEFPDDGQTKYVCRPSGLFYEFIPAAFSDEENPGTLLMEEVCVGECYEMVITNRDGLYRYRMGDVVRITGFYNKAPIFQFQYRNGELLNIRSEKTSEVSVTRALKETMEKLEGVDVIHYVCAESPVYEEATGEESDGRVMYYVIFVELSVDKEHELITHIEERKKFEAEFDANLRSAAESYDHCREKKTLGPSRVILVDHVAFSAFRVLLLETSTAAAGQLKIPRKLRAVEWVQLFLAHRVDCNTADLV